MEKWGVEQARKYIGLLEDAFERVAALPSYERAARHWRGGIYRYRCEQHVIYFTRGARTPVTFVRVLHKRQLPENYLSVTPDGRYHRAPGPRS